MQIFKKKYFIHPEIQKPLIVVFLSSFTFLLVIQIVALYVSIFWLSHMAEMNMSLVVDFHLLDIWKRMLFFIFFISGAVNLGLSVFMTIFISNKFAGPIYRLEKELDLFISGERKEFNVNFRRTDYLRPLAQKINQILSHKNEV